MAIAGFRAKNHPQQLAVRGVDERTDDRRTRDEYFQPWREQFGFTLDVAASAENTKCEKFFTREQDGLVQSWAGESVWCNPPYSDVGSWVAKAWGEYRSTNGIVMLLPANRTEQKWWQQDVEPWRDRDGSPLLVKFLPGRMRFDRPDVVIGPKGDRPPFGCCLLIWRDIKTKERF